MKIVIAGAGPLIALSRIDQLQLLQQLFQKVVITETTRDEILVNGYSLGKEAVEQAINAQWLNIKKVNLKTWQPLNPGVDAGESSAIFLATQAPESTLLIMDDQAGRAEARYQKLAVVGTAAIIGMAKEQGFIDSAKTMLYELRDVDYYIGDTVLETVLKDIGE